MPFYDLNVPWSPTPAETQRTLTFLHECAKKTTLCHLNDFTFG